MLFTTEVSAKIYINYRVNPPNVECDALLEAYSYKELLYMASLEYFYLEKSDTGLHDLESRVSQTGALPCFCSNQAAEGYPADYLYYINRG